MKTSLGSAERKIWSLCIKLNYFMNTGTFFVFTKHFEFNIEMAKLKAIKGATAHLL